MEPKQQPGEVKVFGSAVLRVAPDRVSLQFSVRRQCKQPGGAFRDTRQAVRLVREYLGQAGVKDVASSHVSLARNYEITGGNRVPAGYVAFVSFNVVLAELDRMEDILSGVVDAGASEIASTEFRTSLLKEYRAEARRRAVDAAREKAEIYCRAAGVSLGPVLRLEDVNPATLRGTGEGHTDAEEPPDDSEALRSLAPGSIVVGAAVWIAFAIGS